MDLVQLLRVLWAGRWAIAVTCLVTTTMGLSYSWLATEWFRADIVLLPADQHSASGVLGQLGSIAAIAGFGTQDRSTVEPVAMLRSKELARRFIKARDLADTLRSALPGARIFEGGGAAENDLREVVDYFNDSIRRVHDDPKSGLVHLTIEWTDPVTAARWANELVAELNAVMRERALDSSTRNIEYLQRQLSETNVVALQQAIGRLLDAELQRLMLARGSEEFGFRVIDPAQPPTKRAWPQRALIVLVAFLSGFLLSALFILARTQISERL